MTATEMATELGDRIKHEGEKLRALELVTLPVRKKEEPKGRSKFKTVSFAMMLIGIGYAIFRAVRSRANDVADFTPRPADASANGTERRNEPRFATAGS